MSSTWQALSCDVFVTASIFKVSRSRWSRYFQECPSVVVISTRYRRPVRHHRPSKPPEDYPSSVWFDCPSPWLIRAYRDCTDSVTPLLMSNSKELLTLALRVLRPTWLGYPTDTWLQTVARIRKPTLRVLHAMCWCVCVCVCPRVDGALTASPFPRPVLYWHVRSHTVVRCTGRRIGEEQHCATFVQLRSFVCMYVPAHTGFQPWLARQLCSPLCLGTTFPTIAEISCWGIFNRSCT